MDKNERQLLSKAIKYINYETVDEGDAVATRRGNTQNPMAKTVMNNSPYAVKPTAGAFGAKTTYSVKPPKQATITENVAVQKPMDLKFDFRVSADNRGIIKSQPASTKEGIVSAERLQEAIIWSEILGKPVSKRRQRRESW